MPDRSSVQWQPISMLPTIRMLADEARDGAEEQIESFQIAITRPSLLDGETIQRSLRVYTEQQEFLMIYAEQVQRWRATTLTAIQARDVDALEAVVHEATTLTTALLALIRQCAEQPALDDTPRRALERAAHAMLRDDPDAALIQINGEMDRPWPAPWMAELYVMRGTALEAQGDAFTAAEDYQRAITLAEADPSIAPIQHLNYLAFFANAIAEYDPEAALTASTRHNTLAEAHRKTLMGSHPTEALLWPGAALGVAVGHELLDRPAEARQWYQIAAQRCDEIDLPAMHPFRAAIADGVARNEQIR